MQSKRCTQPSLLSEFCKHYLAICFPVFTILFPHWIKNSVQAQELWSSRFLGMGREAFEITSKNAGVMVFFLLCYHLVADLWHWRSGSGMGGRMVPSWGFPDKIQLVGMTGEASGLRMNGQRCMKVASPSPHVSSFQMKSEVEAINQPLLLDCLPAFLKYSQAVGSCPDSFLAICQEIMALKMRLGCWKAWHHLKAFPKWERKKKFWGFLDRI